MNSIALNQRPSELKSHAALLHERNVKAGFCRKEFNSLMEKIKKSPEHAALAHNIDLLEITSA